MNLNQNLKLMIQIFIVLLSCVKLNATNFGSDPVYLEYIAKKNSKNEKIKKEKQDADEKATRDKHVYQQISMGTYFSTEDYFSNNKSRANFLKYVLGFDRN